MSLYNMVEGFSGACFFVAPLVVGHPEDNVPRFRDCFLGDDEHPEYDGKIHIYTRVGGGNREDYQAEIGEMRGLDGYITDYDDSFDDTYATFIYEIPEKYKPDVEHYLGGNLEMTSKEYQRLILRTYPKIKDKLAEMFS